MSAILLKGVGKINGDGFKDSTKIGQVVYVWNKELPRPYQAGQYPRVGCEHWSASVDQYDFTPVEDDSVCKGIIELLGGVERV